MKQQATDELTMSLTEYAKKYYGDDLKSHLLADISMGMALVDKANITDVEIAQAIVDGMGDRAIGVAMEIKELLAPSPRKYG